MLAQLGHRHAAYVTAFAHSEWSLQRWRGVDRGLCPSGDGSTEWCVIEHDDSAPAAGVSVSGAAAADSPMHRHTPLVRGLMWPEQQIARLRESYGPWENICARLDRLLDNKDITAWVADNDPTALICLSFLEQRRAAVPGRISVAGFDDGNLALVNNLTSYNFNCRAVVLAALDHLLAPAPSRAGRPVPERVEIEGHLVQRGTTGRSEQAE
jgi:DNA-binding LacI/PurR family transcriptional regulator